MLQIPETLRVQLPDGQVTEMSLEEYLQGVVPAEMGLNKPIEALKAQAIAARSFAISTRRHAQENLDVCTTTHCQVWKPEKRYAESDRAVAETAGQVVTYQGQIVAVHYFAHCDGHTRRSEEVWSGEVGYYRSVPCICGYTTLHGHGVGMCQQGAVAMATQQGAQAHEILKHYYHGIEIAQAEMIPRTAFQRSVILGQVTDGQGQPRGDVRLVLEGSGGLVERRTTSDGRFWFSQLPAGTWRLRAQGRPVQYDGLFTDGRNSLEVRVAVPQPSPDLIRTVPLAYPKELVGTLGYQGVPVTIVDPAGNEATLLSGSAPFYDPGGFAMPVTLPGRYTLRVLGKSYDIEISDLGAWLEFSYPAT